MPASTKALGERLLALEERLERVERLSYLCYVETRRVAEYAYLNVLLEEDADSVRRMKGMRSLSDTDALSAGLSFQDLVALKVKMRFLTARCKSDVLGIAKELAEERKRRPIVQHEEEAEEAA